MATPPTNKASGRWIRVIPAVAGLGVLAILLFVTQVPANTRWSTFGTALMIAGAAGVVGGLVGFLFGIPRTVQGQGPSSPGETQFQGNTNLEQVSDWLTKILVGVGLVQIGRSVPALTKLADNLKAPLGGVASSAAFGLGLMITYAALGFLFLYLWSRERLPQELRLADAIQLTIDAHDSAQTAALVLVNKQLTSQQGGAPPSQNDLNRVIVDASDATRLQVFDKTERVRSANWQDAKAVMATTIPVFRALIAADTKDEHHRNHGSLGWALKDQTQPEWQAAADELSNAITIRNQQGMDGWKLYEANRAVCNIHLLQDLALPADAPQVVALTNAINSDLQAALDDDYARPMLEGDPDIQQWRAQHPF